MQARPRLSSQALLLMVLLAAPLAAEDADPGPLGLDQFTSPVLLARFDRNGDGQLDLSERRQIRRAFGGVEIPLLPKQATRFTQTKRPARLRKDQLSAADNTPPENPLSDAGAALGRVLFYDRQLSKNGKISCASCHDQSRGFADPRRFSPGFEGKLTRRNAMGLANMRYTVVNGRRAGFFWDERAATLESQILAPIQDPVEMGMQLPELEAKLQKLPYYPALFENAFGTKQVTSDRIAKAVAQFLRSMVAFDSKFDRAAEKAKFDYSQEFEQFSPLENLGKSLFIDGLEGVGEMGCAHCHVPPTFAMPQSFNNGLDLVYADRGLGERNLPPTDPFTSSNNGKFKASSLRNIALTGPYMHDGRFAELEEVVDHYSSGVHPHDNVGIALPATNGPKRPTSGFQFNSRQKQALVAFLKTLTDTGFVADQRFSDPFLRTDK